MQSRIIFIPGIITAPALQKFQWGRAAKQMFPDREIICIDKIYVYPQHAVLRELREQVMNLLRDGVPTMLVGHSFGGIIATAVAHQAQQEGLDNIVRLVTLATPHTMNVPSIAYKIPTPDSIDLDLEEARQVVGYRFEPLDIPVYTQGARWDHVVPRQYTHYPGEQAHVDVLSTHSGFWLAPRSWRYCHMWNYLRD